MKFTKDDVRKLDLLIGRLMRQDEMFQPPNSPHMKTVHQLVNECTVPTLKGYYTALNEVLKAESDAPWEEDMTDYQKRLKAKKLRWRDFILLLIKYKTYEAQKATLKAKKLAAKKKVDEIDEQYMKPKDRKKKAKQELEALEDKLVDFDDEEEAQITEA